MMLPYNYITGKDPENLISLANRELIKFTNWCFSNRLTVNLSKTYFMLFTNLNINSLSPFFFNNRIINRTNQHTLLGVTFGDKLTFKAHISNLILKLSRNVSLFYQIRELMPKDIYVLRIMYNSHILSHLQYCTPIWCNTYPTHLLPLFRMQKKIIRITTNSDFLAHPKPLFKNTMLLNLFDLNQYEIAIYMYNLIRNQNIQVTQHNYPTSTRENLRIPLHNLTLFKHSLAYQGPKTWNSIPNQIKSLKTIHSFKKQ